jgi:tripartite-type tricarboxylate transporter receptor subunit TctC
LPYNPTEDFTFIGTTAEFPLVLVTNPDSGIKSVADIGSIARSRNEPLLYGTAGVGSLMHLSRDLFAKKANIHLQHVPYKGGMTGGHRSAGQGGRFGSRSPAVSVQFIRAEKLRPLAVTSANRFFALPNVPTMIEAGFAGCVVTGYQGIAAPAGIPQAVTMKLNDALRAVLADTAIVEKLKNIGNIPKPSSPEEYKARVATDIALWKGVVADAHISLS